MKRKFWNWIKNEESGIRTLRLDGVIASDAWFDDDVTPKMFQEDLNAGTGDIVVWINSPGGDCGAAAQIYNMMMEYQGNITVKTDGIAASAASVIAMAGGTVETGEVDLKGADTEHISTEIVPEFIQYYTNWKKVTDDAYAVITVTGRDTEKKVTYTSHSYKYSIKDAPIIAHYTTVKSSVETATYTYYKVQELTMVPKKTKIEGSEKESIKYPLQDGCYGTLDGKIYDEEKSLVSSTGLEEPVGFYKIKKGIYVLLKKAGNYKNNALYLIQAGKGAEKVGDVTNKKVRPLKALPAYISGR